MTEANPNPQPAKPGRLKWLFPIGLFVLFMAGIIFSYRHNPGATVRELPNFKADFENRKTGQAPEFEVLDLNGQRVRLSDLRGMAALVNFWSVSCPACLIELRSLASLSEQLSGKPFALVAITSDRISTVKEFLGETQLKLPAYFDDTGETGQSYGVVYLPASFVIDPEGKLVDAFTGAAKWDDPQIITYFQKLIELYQPKKPSP